MTTRDKITVAMKRIRCYKMYDGFVNDKNTTLMINNQATSTFTLRSGKAHSRVSRAFACFSRVTVPK